MDMVRRRNSPACGGLSVKQAVDWRGNRFPPKARGRRKAPGDKHKRGEPSCHTCRRSRKNRRGCPPLTNPAGGFFVGPSHACGGRFFRKGSLAGSGRFRGAGGPVFRARNGCGGPWPPVPVFRVCPPHRRAAERRAGPPAPQRSVLRYSSRTALFLMTKLAKFSAARDR